MIARNISAKNKIKNRRDGVVVRASASQSVDMGFISQVESYQKTLKNGIHSFPAWRSVQKGYCEEQGGKLACCVLGQGTQQDASIFMLQTGGGPITRKTRKQSISSYA